MNNLINMLSRLADKSGAVGAVIATMGCAMCFPALASVAAAIGLGFLSQWEGLFINSLLPAFAWLALVANLVGMAIHRRWLRGLPGMLGPILLLLSLYPWFRYGWSTWVTYGALFLMVTVALADLIWPARRHCPAPHPEDPA